MNGEHFVLIALGAKISNHGSASKGGAFCVRKKYKNALVLGVSFTR